MRSYTLFLSAGLLLAGTSLYGQTDADKTKLKAVAEEFLTIYNTGDTAVYRKFLSRTGNDAEANKQVLIRYGNTYRSIGKVNLRQVSYASPTQVVLTVQEPEFESWWKFTVNTNSLHQFMNRTVLPLPFQQVGLRKVLPDEQGLQRELDSYIDKLGSNFSGNILIATPAAEKFFRSVGNDENGKLNTRETRFGLASVGKMFTGIAILQLAEKGMIELDAPVTKYLPSLQNPKLSSITIRHLLTNTSGMGDFFEDPSYELAKDTLTSPAKFVSFYEKDQLSFKPGAGYRYSNTGFNLLGWVVERVSGMPFKRYADTNIFQPAGMRSAEAGDGAGGGHATVDDMKQFAEALMRRKLLDNERTMLLLTYQNDHNYGFASEHQLLGNEHIVGHSGGFIKQCLELNIYQHTEQLVIIMSNSNPPFGHFLGNKVKGLLISD